jgi:asparagine synthase (glutamine-hydrolysing)
MWAIAIWDKLNKSIFLSRDRFGIKPLYYTKLKNTFAFSSEIKALLVLGPAHRQVSRKMIYQYLVFGKLNESYMTLFSNIMELPSGCNLVYHINEHDYRITEYYDLSAHVTNNEIHINSAPIIQYNSIFEHSLDLHLRADVPVGSCLSGGLDSSAIVAYSALKLSNNSLNTFTASYRDNQIDESRYARLVSSHYTNIKSHFTYPSSTIFWQDIDKLIWHQDLPIGSTSIFAQWEVMKLASGHKMKVLLDGQGADESLGGYSIFVGILLLSLLKRGKISPFIRNVYNLNKNQNTSILNNIGRAAFFLIPAVFQRKLQNRYRISSKFISSHINKELQIDKNIPRISKTLNIKDTCLQMIKSGLHELLRYEDRNSMAFSIESRLPFLDHRLVEYTMSLENKWKINNGWSKYILRKISEPILPKEVVWRKDKKGFITPQQNWKQELANDILNYLQNFPLPDILNKNNILDYCKKDISQPSHLSEFWRMFSFLKWIQVNNIKF